MIYERKSDQNPWFFTTENALLSAAIKELKSLIIACSAKGFVRFVSCCGPIAVFAWCFTWPQCNVFVFFFTLLTHCLGLVCHHLIFTRHPPFVKLQYHADCSWKGFFCFYCFYFFFLWGSPCAKHRKGVSLLSRSWVEVLPMLCETAFHSTTNIVTF